MPKRRVPKSIRFLKPIAAMGLLLLVAGPALACGNAFMYAILFNRLPEAKAVFSADLSARTTGVLAPDVWVPESGLSLHEWNRDRATAAVSDLATRLSGVTGREAGLSVLLVGELYGAEIAGSAGVGFEERNIHEQQFGFVTTTNVLRGLLDGELAWAEAVDANMVAFTTELPEQQVIALSAAFASVN